MRPRLGSVLMTAGSGVKVLGAALAITTGSGAGAGGSGCAIQRRFWLSRRFCTYQRQ